MNKNVLEYAREQLKQLRCSALTERKYNEVEIKEEVDKNEERKLNESE